MNLDFGIFWIEDSYSEEEEQNLRRRVQQAGFIARIQTSPNGSGIMEVSRQHKLYHLFDLILLDYRLKGEDGDDLAPRVRELFPSTTILFYSGTEDEDTLRKMIAAKQVEGVYCSARTRFIDRAGTLIEQTAKSLDRLSGMRGLAMRVVAECDELMKEAVLAMSSRDGACQVLVEKLDEDVLSFIANLESDYKASMESTLDARLRTRGVDSAKLFHHFRRLTKVAARNSATFGLDEDEADRFRELRLVNARYENEVLLRRNTLGHAIELRTDEGWVIEGKTEMRSADFPEMRRHFAAHIDAVRELAQLVSPEDDAVNSTSA